jgi:hypothetical protein
MIVFIGTSLQLHSVMTAHNQWLSTTRSVPCETTSVFSSTVTNHERRTKNRLRLNSGLSYEWLIELSEFVTTDCQSASLSWNKTHIWGLQAEFLLSDSCDFADVGRSLWREDESVVYNCRWRSPAQSFSGTSPVGLAVIFYCLRFETSFSSPPTTRRVTVEVFSKSKLYYDRRSAGQSVLEQSTHLGLTTRSWLLSDSCGVVGLGRPLWREDGFAVCNCYWPSPAQSFSGQSPAGLVAILYCLRFETSLFVASYDLQGHGEGIRSRLHTCHALSL